MSLRRAVLRVVLFGCGSAFWGAFAGADEVRQSTLFPQNTDIFSREIFPHSSVSDDPRRPSSGSHVAADRCDHSSANLAVK
jgi:hypothetical protein